jgi:hypothetical protein
MKVRFLLGAPFGKWRNRWVRRSQRRRPMRAPQRENSSPPRAAVKKNEEKRKNFKELLLNSNGHPGCSQTLSDLPKVAIKKSER